MQNFNNELWIGFSENTLKQTVDSEHDKKRQKENERRERTKSKMFYVLNIDHVEYFKHAASAM